MNRSHQDEGCVLKLMGYSLCLIHVYAPIILGLLLLTAAIPRRKVGKKLKDRGILW